MGMPRAMRMVRDSIIADGRSSGAKDGLLRKTQTEQKRVYAGAGKKLGGRKLKQGSRLSGLATTFFPVYFIFFISLMFHSL